MNRDKLICAVASAVVALIMTATAIVTASFSGGGDAYIPATPTDAGRTESGAGTDGGERTDAPTDDGTDIKNTEAVPGTSAPETVSGTEQEPVGTEETPTGDVKDETGEPETDKGAGGALGGLGQDAAPPETTFETWTTVIPATTVTEPEDSETEPVPPEPDEGETTSEGGETTDPDAPVTMPPATSPGDDSSDETTISNPEPPPEEPAVNGPARA